jgi:hypothetical protein
LKKWLQKLWLLVLNMFRTNNMHHNVLEAIMKCHIRNGAQHVMNLTTPLYFPLKKLKPSNKNKIPTWSQQVLNIDYLCGSIWALCFFAVSEIEDDYYCCYVLQCVFCSWKNVFHNKCNSS